MGVAPDVEPVRRTTQTHLGLGDTGTAPPIPFSVSRTGAEKS
jgi:hypothetical protein